MAWFRRYVWMRWRISRIGNPYKRNGFDIAHMMLCDGISPTGVMSQLSGWTSHNIPAFAQGYTEACYYWDHWN